MKKDLLVNLTHATMIGDKLKQISAMASGETYDAILCCCVEYLLRDEQNKQYRETTLLLVSCQPKINLKIFQVSSIMERTPTHLTMFGCFIYFKMSTSLCNFSNSDCASL